MADPAGALRRDPPQVEGGVEELVIGHGQSIDPVLVGDPLTHLRRFVEGRNVLRFTPLAQQPLDRGLPDAAERL